MKLSVKKILFTTILVLILVISFYRVMHYTILFSEQSVQMDFTAYYSAGKSLNNDLSPYVNYVLTRWNLWDGIAAFKHSRFLYPPLVANLFQPIATLPYINAKYVWNFFNLFCLIICFLLLVFIFWKKDKEEAYKKTVKILISGILTFNFFPFLALLERGQIDCVTLLFLLIGFSLLIKKEKYEFLSGVFFGIATLFKLYSILLIPFFFIQKKYKVIYGYFTGVIILIILTLLISGKNLSYDYLTKEAPRIAKYGSGGTEEMRIPAWILQSYLPMTPTSITIVDERMYLTESISFNSKASFIRILEVSLPKFLSNSVLSLIVFGVFLIFLFIYRKKFEQDSNVSPFIYWQIILIVITLSSPYTWVMNLVWLLPFVFIVIEILPEFYKKRKYILITLIIIGYLLLSIPDNLLLTKQIKIFGELFKSRFIIAEFILLGSLVTVLFISREKKSEKNLTP
jgi:hypothetical protein